MHIYSCSTALFALQQVKFVQTYVQYILTLLELFIFYSENLFYISLGL